MCGSCSALEPDLQQVNGGRLTEDAIATFYQDEAFNQMCQARLDVEGTGIRSGN